MTGKRTLHFTLRKLNPFELNVEIKLIVYSYAKKMIFVKK